MKTKITIIFIAFAVVLMFLGGCENKSMLDDSQKSSMPSKISSQKNTNSADVQTSTFYINDCIENVKNAYNIKLPIKRASDVFNVKKIDGFSESNDNEISYVGIIDDDTILVNLYKFEDDNLIINDTGLIHIFDNSYTSLGAIQGSICAYNNQYIVYKKYNGDFTTEVEDESVKLFLFDILKKEEKLIFMYSFSRNEELSHYINNIEIIGKDVYFDDVINDYQQAILYKYNIDTSLLTIVSEDAQNPFEFNNNLIFMKLKDGQYSNLVSIDNEFNFDMNFHSVDIRVGNYINSLDIVDTNDAKRETTWGLNDWNYYTNNKEYVLKTTRTISNLVCGGDFSAFTDYIDGLSPIVYNSKTKEFIVFDEVVGSASWLIGDNIGILITIEDVYLFMTK